MNVEYFFLKFFFKELERNKVKYAVLRNYEKLPYSAGGSDIDLLILPENKSLIMRKILSSISSAGGTVIGSCIWPNFWKLSILIKNRKNTSPNWVGQEIDINWGLYYKSVVSLIDTSLFEEWHIFHNGIKVVDPDLASVIGVFKEVIHNGILPERYLKKAKKIDDEKWEKISKWLAPIGVKMVYEIKDIIEKKPSHLEVKLKAIKFKLSLSIKSFLKSPLKYIFNRARHLLSKIFRFLNPPGIVISILGTDGVGKSTLISSLRPVLSSATHRAFYVKHLRPGLLPPLARFRGVKQSDVPSTNPHGSKPSGFLLSIFRASYLLFDYILGYWLIVRPKISKKPAVFIFDRYIYDMILDPIRFRIGIPGKILKWVTYLAPKPDLIICLDASPETIFLRKKELSKKEIERQISALREFAKKENRAVLISAEDSKEEVCNRVLEIICKFCLNRIKLK